LKLSIIVPAYNEEQRIPRMLSAYLDYFESSCKGNYELMVVVNGSRDKTADVVRGYVSRFPTLSVIEVKEAIGKGGAILLGFKHASGDLVGFVDADGSTPPEAFHDLARNIRDAGVIIASRWFPESVVEPKQPLKRRIVSRIFNFIIRLLFGLKINDTQCGAKILTARALKAVMPRIGITRWAFDVDLLFQIHRAGFSITEWPTVWRDEGGSQLRIFKASFEMLVAIIRLRLVYSPLRWLVTLYDQTLGRITHPRL